MRKANRKLAAKRAARAPQLLKLDLGCGGNRREGYLGVDRIPGGKVDLVLDLVARTSSGVFRPWPWKDNSVGRVHCSHMLEHLDQEERAHFVRELYRVLAPATPGTTPPDNCAEIITPDIFSERAYGDPTHKMPPVCGMWFNYLEESWRRSQAPHTDTPDWYKGVNFSITWGYGLRPDLAQRDDEYRTYALTNYVGARTDMIATWVKVVRPKG
jgi:hypothetical protein